MPIRMGLTLFLAALCWLAPAHALPNTEVYAQLRLLASPQQTRARLAQLRRIPLAAWALKTLDELTGVRVERDLLSWWRGTARVALVRTGEVSPLQLIYRRNQGAADYAELLDELRNLGVALDSYKLARGKLPASLEALVPDFLEAVPQRPGVTFRLENAAGGWLVRAEIQPDSELARQGRSPVNSEKDGLDSESWQGRDPVGFVLALDCTVPAEAARTLRRLDTDFSCLESAGENRWKLACEGTPALHIAIREGWLLACDEASLLDRELFGDLAANPRYAFERKILPAADEVFVFADLQEIFGHCPDLSAEARAALVPLRSLGLAAWGVGRPIPTEMHTQLFLEVEPSALGPLAQTPGRSPSELAGHIPWEISDFVALDLGRIYRLAERIAATHPQVGVALTTTIARAQEVLGVELSREFLQDQTGRLLLTYERIDCLAALLEVFDDFREPSKTRQEEPEPAASPQATPQPVLRRLPFVAALELNVGPVQDALFRGLLTCLGPAARFYEAAGVRVETSADGRIAVARLANLVLCAGGGSSRLLDRFLETTTGRHPSLALLDSHRSFEERLVGQQLLLAHTKVDWLYSLVKGFILLLGADFRAEATALGLWRDVFGALTLEGQGLRFTVTLFATEQVPR